eukprot:2971000-Prymnesium_polylepis.3
MVGGGHASRISLMASSSALLMKTMGRMASSSSTKSTLKRMTSTGPSLLSVRVMVELVTIACTALRYSSSIIVKYVVQSQCEADAIVSDELPPGKHRCRSFEAIACSLISCATLRATSIKLAAPARGCEHRSGRLQLRFRPRFEFQRGGT